MLTLKRKFIYYGCGIGTSNFSEWYSDFRLIVTKWDYGLIRQSRNSPALLNHNPIWLL